MEICCRFAPEKHRQISLTFPLCVFFTFIFSCDVSCEHATSKVLPGVLLLCFILPFLFLCVFLFQFAFTFAFLFLFLSLYLFLFLVLFSSSYNLSFCSSSFFLLRVPFVFFFQFIFSVPFAMFLQLFFLTSCSSSFRACSLSGRLFAFAATVKQHAASTRAPLLHHVSHVRTIKRGSACMPAACSAAHSVVPHDSWLWDQTLASSNNVAPRRFGYWCAFQHEPLSVHQTCLQALQL